MKSLLLFLAGVLVGANVVYFLVARPGLPGPPAPDRAPMAQCSPSATDAMRAIDRSIPTDGMPI